MKKIFDTLFILLFVTNISLSYAKTGLYISADTGVAIQTSLPSASQLAANEKRNKYMPPAWHAATGYNHDFYFDPSLGLGFEIGYSSYNQVVYKYSNRDISVRTKSMEFLLVPIWHYNDFSFLIKAGGLREHVAISDPNIARTYIAFSTGIGAMYNLDKHWSIGVNYMYVKGDKMDYLNPPLDDSLVNQNPTVHSAMLGLRYTFP